MAKSRSEELEAVRNAEKLGFTMYSWRQKPVDLQNARKTKYRITSYFEMCRDCDKIPDPVSLCNWLGVGKQQMDRWRAGIFGSAPGEKVFQDTLVALEEIWMTQFEKNKNLPTYYIFIGKNWFGYKDTQDVQITPNTPLGEVQNADELKKRIAKDVVIDIEPTDVADAD